jgi:hypothetical protein
MTAVLLPLVRTDAPQRAAEALGPAALERWCGGAALPGTAGYWDGARSQPAGLACL